MADKARGEEARQFLHDFDLITLGRYSNPKQSIYWILKERRATLKQLTDENHSNQTKIKDAMINVWAAELLQWTEASYTFEVLQGAAVTVGASIEVDWTGEAQLLEMIGNVKESIRVWVEEIYPEILPDGLPAWTDQKRQLDKCLWWANVLLEACRRGWTMGGAR